MTRVLALDLATKTGWACGNTDRDPVSHGVAVLPSTGEDIGWFADAFEMRLAELLDEMEPDHLVFESPILRGKKTSLAAARKLCGLAYHTELIARRRKLLVTEANLSEIRDHFIGITSAPRDVPKAKRRQWLKDKVVAECKRRGFSVTSDDDADAIALLSLRLSQLDATYSLKATPLFQERAA